VVPGSGNKNNDTLNDNYFDPTLTYYRLTITAIFNKYDHPSVQGGIHTILGIVCTIGNSISLANSMYFNTNFTMNLQTTKL
jgi:hypothetical protein